MLFKIYAQRTVNFKPFPFLIPLRHCVCFCVILAATWAPARCLVFVQPPFNECRLHFETSLNNTLRAPEILQLFEFPAPIPHLKPLLPRFLRTRLNSIPCLVLLSKLQLRALQSGLGATSFIEPAVAVLFSSWQQEGRSSSLSSGPVGPERGPGARPTSYLQTETLAFFHGAAKSRHVHAVARAYSQCHVKFNNTICTSIE